MRRLIATGALVFAMALPAHGQSGSGYDLSWWTTAAGPVASGGGFAARGAAGQPTVEYFSAGALDGRGGYYQRATTWWELRMPIVRR